MTNENIQYHEKRAAERVKVTLNKAFNCDINMPDGEVMNCFVHIENISTLGMQLHIDFPLPDDTILPITLYAKETITLTMKKIWQKQLAGGTIIMGFAFTGDEAENAKKIISFTNQFSPEGRRKAYRLNKVLAVELSIAGEVKKFYTLTQDLSSKGMRIMNDVEIPIDTLVNIKMLLEVDKPYIDLNCKVIWTKPTSFEHFLIGLEFLDITPEISQRIESFIDACFLEDEKDKNKKLVPEAQAEQK